MPKICSEDAQIHTYIITYILNKTGKEILAIDIRDPDSNPVSFFTVEEGKWKLAWNSDEYNLPMPKRETELAWLQKSLKFNK